MNTHGNVLANLKGIQTLIEENLPKIIVNIVNKLGVSLTADNIEAVHRLPSRVNKLNAPIIVELSSRKKCEEILSKKMSVVTNQDIYGSGYDNKKIFINQSLSPFYKNLLYRAKVLSREKGYDYCWFKNSKILVRKSNKEKNVIIINEENDLEKIQ